MSENKKPTETLDQTTSLNEIRKNVDETTTLTEELLTCHYEMEKKLSLLIRLSHNDKDIKFNNVNLSNIIDGNIRTLKEILPCVSDDLISYLDSLGYFYAPSAKSHHSNYPGGLFSHSVVVSYYLYQYTKALHLEWKRDAGPIIVGMFHDLCKCDDYRFKNPDIFKLKENRNIKEETLSFSMEDCEVVYNENKRFLGHGDKSILMMPEHLFPLEEDEKLCIIYHMGSFTEKEKWNYYNNAIRENVNVLYTHTADMVAAIKDGI